MARSHPTVAADDLAWLSEAEMVEVDRIMIDELHIELVQMMENAGRSLARLTLDLTTPDRVTVLAGSGGNGGGGMVAARHLANQGVDVTVALTRQDPGGVPGHQLDILRRMEVPVLEAGAEPPTGDAVVDAVIGYRLHGAPRGRAADLISVAPTLGPVIALDTPSGLEVTTGWAPGVAVGAEATLTLALPKRGLRNAASVGDLYLADISVPPAVYGRLRIGPAPDFSRSPILRVSR